MTAPPKLEVAAFVAPPAEAPDDADRLRSLADFRRDPDAMRPPTPVVPRLAWAGRITLFASSEGWGKSSLARAGAAAVTTGQRFLDGAAAPPGDVLWARLEESEYDLMAGVTGAGFFGADPERFVAWTPGGDPVRQLVARLRDLRPALTVVDSIQELAILAGVEKLDDAGQVGRALSPLAAAGRELGTAMLWLGQASKATGRYRNSSWLGHTADAVLEIREPDLSTNLRQVEVRKRRMDVFGYRVELAGDRYRLVAGTAPAEEPRLSPVRRRVLALWRPGTTWGPWAEACNVGDGEGRMPKSTFNGALRWLRERGLITVDDETGVYGRDQPAAEQERVA